MAQVPILISISNGVASATPDPAMVRASDTVLWTHTTGHHWPPGVNAGQIIQFLSGTQLIIPASLQFMQQADGSRGVQGTVIANAILDQQESYTASVPTLEDDSVILTTSRVDEYGNRFDPKIQVKA
jgi:hypothetical protein